MKNTPRIVAIAIVATAALLAAAAHAAPKKAITNYYPGATFTSSNITFKFTALTNASYTSTMITNDVRPMLVSIVRKFMAVHDAAATTNQFSTFDVSENTQWNSSTNRTIYYTISEGQVFTITPTYPSN